MKTLHFYLTRQILQTVLMTVMVFTFVLLLGNVLKEILSLLVNHQVSFLLAGQAIGLLIPFVLVFALPMGMLTGALLVFGRFSADQELTAARASGISLLSLVTPVLLLSVILSVVCAAVNLYIAPQCRVAYKRLLYKMGTNPGTFLLPEQTYIKDFKDLIVYAGKINGADLEDILVYKLQKNGKIDSYIKATSGRWQMIDPTNQIIQVDFNEFWHIAVGEEKYSLAPFKSYAVFTSMYFTNNPNARSEEKVKISDMTFWQLNDQLLDLERRFINPEMLRGLPKEEIRKRAVEMEKRWEEMSLPTKMQIHRQASFSFACIAFTLIGIPLGIRAHRRETTFNIAVALLLVALYYSFFIFGQSLDNRPELVPYLILWLPNFIFQAVGAVLLWRANRGI